MPVSGEDWLFTGSVSGAGIVPGNATVDNDKVKAGAGISPEKLLNLFSHVENFGLDKTDTPVAANRDVFRARGDATIRYFGAYLRESGTSTDVDFDLKINGVSALSAPVNVVHGDGDGTLKPGTLSTTALSDGDIVEIDLAVTSTTGAQGPRAILEIEGVAN